MEQRVIGHEGLGIIEKIGEGVTTVKKGKRVVIEPNIPCRQCKQCLKGKGNSCGNKRVLGLTEDGCFAQYICLPAAFAHVVPDSISGDDAVCTEPMSVAYHALHSTSAQPGDGILIIGLGSIGMLLAHLAIQSGFRVHTMEPNEVLNAKARSMGAIAVEGRSQQEQHDYLESNDIRTIFECAGAGSTAELACDIAARGTDIILLGLSEKSARFQPLKIARENISIRGSIIYDHPGDFEQVLALTEKRMLQPGMIISSHIPLDQLQTALTLAARGPGGKIIIDISA